MRPLLAILVCAGSIAASPRVLIKLDHSTGSTPRDGRLILIVSKEMKGEPRSQVTWGVKTQQIFGKDIDRWKPGDSVEITADTPGDPVRTLADVPAGTYNLQAVLNVYETFHRADGHVLKLHPDHGEGQQWNKSPGNLYSKPQHIEIDTGSVVEVNVTETIPAIDPPKDTKYVRHLRMQSKLLSQFWGAPVFLEATVLVPRDFDSSNQRYPVAFLQTHFGGDFFFLRETPPDAKASQREAIGYQFYQGGWMTLAQQIFYPDYVGGAWGFCPDPVDFHAFQTVNVYDDKNAYYDEGPFQRFPKLGARLPNDHILFTMESFSHQEAILGTRGRSGGQMDAFNATFGPTDGDGYPAKLWNEDGAINPDVSKYWQQHYDLTAYLQRNWDRIGTSLVGKLHVTAGTKDTFYLDAAAHRMQDYLESTKLPGKGPYYAGSFDFGVDKPHCYLGDTPQGVPILTYYARVFGDYIRDTARKGADLAWH